MHCWLSRIIVSRARALSLSLSHHSCHSVESLALSLGQCSVRGMHSTKGEGGSESAARVNELRPDYIRSERRKPDYHSIQGSIEREREIESWPGCLSRDYRRVRYLCVCVLAGWKARKDFSTEEAIYTGLYENGALCWIIRKLRAICCLVRWIVSLLCVG